MSEWNVNFSWEKIKYKKLLESQKFENVWTLPTLPFFTFFCRCYYFFRVSGFQTFHRKKKQLDFFSEKKKYNTLKWQIIFLEKLHNFEKYIFCLLVGGGLLATFPWYVEKHSGNWEDRELKYESSKHFTFLLSTLPERKNCDRRYSNYPFSSLKHSSTNPKISCFHRPLAYLLSGSF